MRDTCALSRLGFRSKPFNLAASCSGCIRGKCATASENSVFRSVHICSPVREWEAEGRHPKAQAFWGTQKHNQRGFFGNDAAPSHFKGIEIETSWAKRGGFDHPSHSPLSHARGIWCWLDKGKQDRYTWNKREGPVGLRYMRECVRKVCFE